MNFTAQDRSSLLARLERLKLSDESVTEEPVKVASVAAQQTPDDILSELESMIKSAGKPAETAAADKVESKDTELKVSEDAGEAHGETEKVVEAEPKADEPAKEASAEADEAPEKEASVERPDTMSKLAQAIETSIHEEAANRLLVEHLDEFTEKLAHIRSSYERGERLPKEEKTAEATEPNPFLTAFLS